MQDKRRAIQVLILIDRAPHLLRDIEQTTAEASPPGEREAGFRAGQDEQMESAR